MPKLKLASKTCDQCGWVFSRSDKPGIIYCAFMRLRFCSYPCSQLGSRQDHHAYFQAHLDPQENGCCHWTGPISDKGYGIIHVDGKRRYAHRYSYELHNAPLGKLHALHSCDNPACVNPDHLRAGTHQDNMRDAKDRDRFAKLAGQDHPCAKLTAEQVQEIRSGDKNINGAAVARAYGVSKSTIYAIRNGSNWRRLNVAA
jgi:hypothetical protein